MNNIEQLKFKLNTKYEEFKKIYVDTFVLNQQALDLVEEIDSLKKEIEDLEEHCSNE